MSDFAVSDRDDPYAGSGRAKRPSGGAGHDCRNAPIRSLGVVVQMSREESVHIVFLKEMETALPNIRSKCRVSCGLFDPLQEKGMVRKEDRDFVFPFGGEFFFEPPELLLDKRGIGCFIFQIDGVDSGQQNSVQPETETIVPQVFLIRCRR